MLLENAMNKMKSHRLAEQYFRNTSGKHPFYTMHWRLSQLNYKQIT